MKLKIGERLIYLGFSEPNRNEGTYIKIGNTYTVKSIEHNFVIFNEEPRHSYRYNENNEHGYYIFEAIKMKRKEKLNKLNELHKL